MLGLGVWQSEVKYASTKFHTQNFAGNIAAASQTVLTPKSSQFSPVVLQIVARAGQGKTLLPKKSAIDHGGV